MGDSNSFHIEVERTGGFAGIKRQGSLNSSELEPSDSREVAALLDRIDLGAIGAAATSPTKVDRFQYRLVVEYHGRRSELVLGESEVPSELRPLLERLLTRR